MIPARLRRQLELVDWDFSEHLPGTSKTVHWYPGTFPADIPTTIIQALSKPDDIVFDPYGGTGTTGLEAIRQARRAVLVEANPVGCLAAYTAGGALLLKALRAELPKLLCEQVRQVVGRLQSRRSVQLAIDTDAGASQLIDAYLDQLISPRPQEFNEQFAWPMVRSNLADWIEAATLHEISDLLEAFNDPQVGYFVRLLGKTMISAILRPASSQTQSWGHIADNVWPKTFVRKDPFKLGHQWLSRFESIVGQTAVAPLRSANVGTRLWVSLHNWSETTRLPASDFSTARLLVTSPPYAGAIDYTLAQRLSFYAFGFTEGDLGNLWRLEFGARRKRNQPHSLEMWAEELAMALELQLGRMCESGFAAFVLPHKDEGRDIGTQIMDECLNSLGWEKAFEVDRSIRQIRARQSWTSIKRETIHIFAK